MKEKLHAVTMEKAYNPKDFEDRIYSAWESARLFTPQVSGGASGTGKFVISIPPPNVTGVLHMGHALDNVLQDIQVRYHRMMGEDTLWVPGTDHAGIATQHVVERRLADEGKTRHDLTREDFIARTWQVKDEHHRIITQQLRRLGVSADWTRERFTLDEGLSTAVREVFVTLYERGLLYQGDYLVNWCPSCTTALADDEVEHTDTQGAMYHIYYPIVDSEERIEIATTRPETMLGDTAVAVHPDDERYARLVGKYVQLPLTGRTIPIVADSYVEKEFGTGVVKITPAHDPNDRDVGIRHNLAVINILTPDGKMNEHTPDQYQGLSVKDARKAVVADLKAQGLFKEKKEIIHSVGSCYRCHTHIEPYLSTQWFVKMRPLAENALTAWKNGDIVFHPKKWENTYSNWLTNIRDWCISRQLLWGHRIPVWYCTDCGARMVLREDPSVCTECGSAHIHQDPDVLDTWFSSWLWPFSVLGWPAQTPDAARFYPNTAVMTGYDIIFFWVARMIMAGLEFTGTVPFKHVFLHGLVRDTQGRKMSKSLGNGIDPIQVIDEYGADAVIFTLSFLCAQGQDVQVDTESFKLGSRFANKVWNASRYLLGNLEDRTFVSQPKLNAVDRWIYHSLNEAVRSIHGHFADYSFNDIGLTAYEFFWSTFCDWYIEATKISFKSGSKEEQDRAATVLLLLLEESLRLLHPLLPFVTEEIYRQIPAACKKDGSAALAVAPYPTVQPDRNFPAEAADFAAVQTMVKAIRALRVDCGIDPQKKITVALFVQPRSHAASVSAHADILNMLAGIRTVHFLNNPKEKPQGSVGTVGTDFEAFIVTDEQVNREQLVIRFSKECEKAQENKKKIDTKLANKKFIQNAPAPVVAVDREKSLELARRIKTLSAYIDSLNSRGV